MKQLSLALLILLWAAPSFAAPVLVRSGEHGDFTRLVLYTNPSVDWTLNQNGRVATLELPRNPDGFSTADVFRRITGDRVQNLVSNGDTLRLDLGCDCVVSATAMAPSYIILDIAPGDMPTGETVAEQSVAPNWSDSIAATESYFGLDVVSVGSEAPARELEAEASLPPAPAAPIILPLVLDPAHRRPFDLSDTPLGHSMLAGGPVKDDPAVEETAEALNILEDRLARQIGLAATQGLLKPAPDPRKERANHTDDGNQVAEGKSAEASLDPLMNHGGLPGNLRITSSVERDDGTEDSIAATIDGLTCLDTDLFAVQDWGVEGQFGAEIARHRNALYGEFDKLDRTAQIGLARAYIYYGFGAEALQIASLEVRDAQVDASIMVLARLMEYGPGPKTEGFSRFAECDSDVALWAILADTGAVRPERMNKAAALRALNKLPYHLRSFVAPQLSKRLRTVGHADAAAQAMRSISRTPHEPESAAKLEQAEIALADGHDSEAGAGFEDVIEENAFEAPLALIRFIDLQVANGESISKDTALLAEAYASEYRDLELAPEIKRAHMMALAKSGQFDEAFVVLQTARKQNMEADELVSALYATLQSDADNVTFLKRTLALKGAELFRMDARTRLLLGERLVKLGFSRQAEELIADIDRNVAPREQQLLRGRIHLALGNHRQALAASAMFDGPEFDTLRADTLYASGDFEDAAEIYGALGQADRAESAAWKAPTGAVAETTEGSSLTRATDLADRPVPQSEGGLLARAGALLSDSSALSADIEELLANPDLNIGAGG